MLAAKKLGDEGKSDLELVLDDVVKMVNTVKANTKKSRLFAQLCAEMDSEVTKLLYHCDVRWLSRGKVLERVLLLREELAVFFTELGDSSAVKLNNLNWLGELSYLSSIFHCLKV